MRNSFDYIKKRPDELTSGNRDFTGNELLVKVESGISPRIIILNIPNITFKLNFL